MLSCDALYVYIGDTMLINDNEVREQCALTADRDLLPRIVRAFAMHVNINIRLLEELNTELIDKDVCKGFAMCGMSESLPK